MRTRSVNRDFTKAQAVPLRGNQIRPRVIAPAIARAPGPKAMKPRQCTINIPGPTLSAIPQRCEANVFKAGRCLEHYNDWRAAREARGIEQQAFRAHQRKHGKVNAHGRITPPSTRVEAVAKPYVRKADRKSTKRPKVA